MDTGLSILHMENRNTVFTPGRALVMLDSNIVPTIECNLDRLHWLSLGHTPGDKERRCGVLLVNE